MNCEMTSPEPQRPLEAILLIERTCCPARLPGIALPMESTSADSTPHTLPMPPHRPNDRERSQEMMIR